jgi:uncharacterized protein (DUF488 family)
MRVFTIGFTQKPASRFFGLLREAGVKRVVDVRLNNEGQLAGFAKRADLEFFLRELGGIGYVHEPLLAPTQAMLDGFKKGRGKAGGKAWTWEKFERAFLELMRERRVEERVAREVIEGGCLLCSEHEPQRCHRRLVAEYLGERWGGVEVVDLM